MWPFTFVNISYSWPFPLGRAPGTCSKHRPASEQTFSHPGTTEQNPCWKHWAELAAQSKHTGYCPALPFVLNLRSQIIFPGLAIAMELSELSSYPFFPPLLVFTLWTIIVRMIYFLFTVNQEALETMLEEGKAKGFCCWGVFLVVLYFCLGLRFF